MNPIRRKLVLSTWRAPKEGNIYGKLTLNATNALAYIEEESKRTGQKLTMTHFVGCAIAKAIKATPSINGYIRFGKFVPHKQVDISFLIALENGKNLANTKVEKADLCTLEEMSKSIRGAATSLRKGEDKEFQKSQDSLSWMPTWLIRPLLWTTGWLTSSLGLAVPMLGLSSFPFGSCMITSVGSPGESHICFFIHPCAYHHRSISNPPSSKTDKTRNGNISHFNDSSVAANISSPRC